MNITIFEEQKNDEIIFNNINTEDIFQAFQLFVNYNILNIPLNINGRIKANGKLDDILKIAKASNLADAFRNLTSHKEN